MPYTVDRVNGFSIRVVHLIKVEFVVWYVFCVSVLASIKS